MASHPARLARPASGSRGTAAASGAPSLVAQAAMAALALVCIAAGLAMTQAYPGRSTIVGIVFAAWVTFAALRFSWAWPAAVALLPIIDLAPRTGWIVFEEFDLLVLATAAGGCIHRLLTVYAGLPGAPKRAEDRPRLSMVAIVLLALFLISTAISLVRGVDAAGGFRFDWTQGYDDPLNAVRIGKSFVLALLMTPLAIDELRKPRGFDRLGLGIAASLALCALAVVQERFAFTGLLDFTGDYRVTGALWEMHVGGAALDGFLALTIPFAVREALRRGSPVHFVGALVVLGLAAYASFVTFSRGVYAAVPVSLLVVAVLVFRQRLKVDRGELWPWLARGAAFAIVVGTAAFFVFRYGGYRAVAALLVLVGATLPIEASIRRTRPGTWIAAAIGALVVAGIGWFVGDLMAKGPYVVFVVATAACAAAIWRAGGVDGSTMASRGRGVDTKADLLAIAAWLWLAIAACGVAWRWGGEIASADAVRACVAIVVLAFASRAAPASMWPVTRRSQLATLGFAVLIIAGVTVFSAGAYMGGRFAGTKSDLHDRIEHWSEGVSRIRSMDEWLFGKGLGRFPATSLYDSPNATYPGSFHLRRRDGERFLALSGPRIRYLGFGELFRFVQRVDVVPDARYQLIVEGRSESATVVHVEVCEKQLLYHAGCAIKTIGLPANLDAWTTAKTTIETAGLGRTSGLASRPVFFSIAVENPGAVAELRRIRLVGPGGIDAIRNGDFGDRTTYWFFSSDKHHLPFHIKNLVLDVLFDQGVVGLALFALLVGGALVRTMLGRARQHPDAPFVAAAIVGFLVVGAFDSLLDVPRVAFLFYTVVLLGLALRSPGLRRGDPAPPATVEAPVPEKVAAPAKRASGRGDAKDDVAKDEAAARALRRQRAFGSRRPPGEEGERR